ncbi:hypothetical protein LTSEHVI_0491 [Salmonella enterica subsp. enterica serovar Hvittingfoss str. A4-620]|nr:hypothetical protein LTSEHVI_0491 [Salmonella enterica subsp. enterica serovar Hvittingfoss str. A4-620]
MLICFYSLFMHMLICFYSLFMHIMHKNAFNLLLNRFR